MIWFAYAGIAYFGGVLLVCSFWEFLCFFMTSNTNMGRMARAKIRMICPQDKLKEFSDDLDRGVDKKTIIFALCWPMWLPRVLRKK